MHIAEDISIYKSCSLLEISIIVIAGFITGIIISILLGLVLELSPLLAIPVLVLPILAIIIFAPIMQKIKRNKPRGYYQKIFAKKLNIVSTTGVFNSYSKI